MNVSLDSDIRYIKGVGEKRAACFKRLHISTVRELLWLLPYRYEDWQTVYNIDAAPDGTELCIKAKICSPGALYKTGEGRTVFRTAASDGFSEISLIFFNNPYAAGALKPGAEFLFYGKIKTNGSGKKEMAAPKYARPEGGARLIPVYPQTAALSSKQIGKAVLSALSECFENIPDVLPGEQRLRYRLLSERDALRMIHSPASVGEIAAARRSLSYTELFTLNLGLLSRGEARHEKTAYIIKSRGEKETERLFPFALTAAQKRAIAECSADMASGFSMRRLLQGDVGSGKTAVAAALMANAAGSGFQCALMAPTEILAKQHFENLSALLGKIGIRVLLLTGSTPAREKREIKEKLHNGEADIIIGTHAVITKDVAFRSLALVITDEQHRFGVSQRAALRQKGERPHVLVMSATPIPRTLSLIIYGDLNVSVLDEKPAGRRRIKTFHIPALLHERMYGFIKKEAAAGHKSFIVCPLVDENEKLSERRAAQDYYSLLSGTVFRGFKTALLHGRLKAAEKEQIMNEFAYGDTQILFCTTVVEVGIDVPSATLIAVENAECFGLSQLHQLRGRVGRSSSQSYCILVSDAKSGTAQKRMEIMCSTDDGFKIADEDLKLRGPGDFFGDRQSGLPGLKAAKLLENSEMLFAARREAENLLRHDRELAAEENRALRERVAALFSDIS